MKDGNNNIFIYMKVNDLEIKIEIILKKILKRFNVLGLTLILISINIPMTYLTHALLNISGIFLYLLKIFLIFYDANIF